MTLMIIPPTLKSGLLIEQGVMITCPTGGNPEPNLWARQRAGGDACDQCLGASRIDHPREMA